MLDQKFRFSSLTDSSQRPLARCLCRPVRWFHVKLVCPGFYGPCLGYAVQGSRNRKGSSQTVPTESFAPV